MYWYERAQEIAKSKNIQNKDIALVLDVTQGAISHYLNGRREPTILQFSMLAQLLGVSLDYLYTGNSTLSDSYLVKFESLNFKNKQDIFAAIRVLSAANTEQTDL